jgi:outer membrane protein OmpA-like peptidoglycan-associated protein
MALPKKYSSRYVNVIYALFIILFAITLSLFYAQWFQKSSSLEKQDTAVLEEKASSDRPSKLANKIDIIEGQSSRKFESSDLDNLVHDENAEGPLSKKASPDNSKKEDKSVRTLLDNSTNPIAKSIHSPPAIKPDMQKAVIYFSADSTGLTEKALKKLRTILLSLLKHPEKKLIIIGYGDSSIIDRHNQKLSQLRAIIAESYFVKRGISTSRIGTYWMGSKNPAGSNMFSEDSNKTHQVEIKINVDPKNEPES